MTPDLSIDFGSPTDPQLMPRGPTQPHAVLPTPAN
jgi:hypothetical protein